MKVYICSPYAGDIKRNKEYARDLTRYAISNGYAPITPHLYLTEALDDRNPVERSAGLETALSLLNGCDALIFGCDYGISRGMRAEIERALSLGIPIYAAYSATVHENGFIKRVITDVVVNAGAR